MSRPSSTAAMVFEPAAPQVSKPVLRKGFKRPASSGRSKNKSPFNVPNLERGLKMMELLLDHPNGLQQTEISTLLGCAKASVYRISMTLMHYGYLVRDEETKVIRLSRKLMAMGSRTLAEPDLMSISVDVMKSLRDQVMETVLIGTLLDTELVVLGQVLGAHHFKFSVDLGTRLPLHSSAPGKAILAMLPANEREDIVRKLPFTRFNDRTICGAEHFRKELAEASANGYSVDRGEQLSGIHCVAAPVVNQHGYPIASLWTTGPTERIRRGEFPELGRKVAHQAAIISARLGYGALAESKPAGGGSNGWKHPPP